MTEHGFRYVDHDTGVVTVVALSRQEAAAFVSTCERARRVGREGRTIHDGALMTHWTAEPHGMSEDDAPVERASGMVRYSGSGVNPNDDNQGVVDGEDDDD